jgi:hypothetical protein
MQVGEIEKIFGAGGSYERLSDGESLGTKFSSAKPGTWRLCFCFNFCDNDLRSTPSFTVTCYYLTNMYKKLGPPATSK